jgi:proteic killer suppression protein
MLVTFEKEYLQELYETQGTTNQQYPFQQQIIKKYISCIDMLICAPNIEALCKVRLLNYRVLTGDKKGISSVRINNQYRIEFKVKTVLSEVILTICNIMIV